jgi:SAM-dependent methyltransferase
VRELVARHRPSARTALELACGTGSILKQLGADYELVGLDRSPEMLAIAAEKVPGIRLVEADMTDFRLDERFDVVLCVYDSLNHLLDFAQWEAVFDRAHEHLVDGGIFVFDVNTERRLTALAGERALATEFGDGHLLVIDVRRGDAANVVTWDVRVYEHEGGARYVLHAEEIVEAAFPRERIAASLGERFRRVAVHDARRKRPSPASERLHFVAIA